LDTQASFAEVAHKFHKGSARMFRSDFLERFSHVHPVTPAALYLPVVAYALFTALGTHGQALPAVLGWFVVGYVLWTLFEYWFHRLFFHLPVRGPVSAKVYFFVHGVHHDYPWDRSRLVMPPAVSLTLAVLMYLLFRGVWGTERLWAPFAGLVFGYVVYDSIHWYTHASKPTTRIGKWLRREHLVHHFKDSGSRFGVSCPWWDHVFRTTGAPSDVQAEATPPDDRDGAPGAPDAPARAAT
jgi:sterol desaturase/sphingolipid hydroxylase (fatty acid hydroxylase superfamily)